MTRLSERERDVLLAVAEGHNQEVACANLGIGRRAFAEAIGGARRKLGSVNDAHLLMLAIREGLLGPDVFADLCPTCGRPS